MNQSPSIHASAVLVGARAVLIQGPSGSGKSRLALALLHAAAQGLIPFARLVADDRAHVEAAHGRLLVRPAAALAGLIEVRGLGIRRVPHEPLAVVGLLVELGQHDGRTTARPASEHRPLSRESRCRGLRSQRAQTHCPWCWPICKQRLTRTDFRRCGRHGHPRKAPYMRRYGAPLKPPARAVYCNAATHYNRSPSP